MDLKSIKPIAKIINYSRDQSYNIFSNNVDFVLIGNNNTPIKEESPTIVPVIDSVNEDNQICCRLEKKNDDYFGIKPFVFRSLLDNFFLINDQLLCKGQSIILRNNDKIILLVNPNNFLKFQDLRSQIENELPVNLIKDYFIEKKLSEGSNGSAFLVHNVRTMRKFVVKRIEKMKNERIDDYTFEAKIMIKLKHPNIMSLFHVHDEPIRTFIFTEYSNYQDLIKYINSKLYCRLDEKEACDCFYQVTQGLKYLHQLNICHRDIKCDNIFVEKQNDQIVCKIGDFGLSAYDNNLTQSCGTVLYSPPEMFNNGQVYKGTRCDIWSLGVLLFCIVSGKFPFHKSFPGGIPIEQQIMSGIIRFRNEEIWDNISYECKHLICCMINVNPICRYDIYEVERHPWLKYHVKLQNRRKRPINETLSKNVNVMERIVLKKPKLKIPLT